MNFEPGQDMPGGSTLRGVRASLISSTGTEWQHVIDCVYVSASRLDARLTRICVASVRRAHPSVPIKLLVGGRLQPTLAKELSQYMGVEVADFPIANYGWGFVKLEPLFGPRDERFLMLDSDTALTGPVMDDWRDINTPFIIDDEEYAPENIAGRYYDWRAVREFDSQAEPPSFVFNSGQWVGTSGVLTRQDFDPWVDWSFPRKLRHPECFFPGEQGILNYVLVQKAMLESVSVARRQIMCWPGHGLDGLSAETIVSGTARRIIIHWAGMKKLRHDAMAGADILAYFEWLYYQGLPSSTFRRRVAMTQNALVHVASGLSVRARLTARKVWGAGPETSQTALQSVASP